MRETQTKRVLITVMTYLQPRSLNKVFTNSTTPTDTSTA